MKKLLVSTVTLAVVMSIATAAWAKEPGVATINGPGLRAPIVFRFDGDGGSQTNGSGGSQSSADAFFRLIDLSGYWTQGKSSTMPDSVLGPKYTMAIQWGTADDPVGAATMDLYPFAQPNPVTFVPEQALTPDGVGPVRGWFLGSSVLLSYLGHYGMPATSPVALPAPAPQAAPQPAPQPAVPVIPHGFPWGWVVGAGGLGVLLLAGALADRSRRRGRIAA